MMNWTSTIIRWTLSSAAFAAVIASAACSSKPTPQPVAKAPEVPLAPADPFSLPVSSAVNQFGEFDGRGPTSVNPVGMSGYQQHSFIEEGFDSAVTLDPTGKWLLYSSTRHSEHPDIYLQRTDGLAVQKLTEDPADDAFPVFSPGGKQIAFCSNRSGIWQIYMMDLDGKNVTQLTSGTMQCVHPSFSPDGMKLVYSSLSARSNQWELWTIDLNTNEKRQIGYGLFPTWCPDSKQNKIAFQRARQRGSRWFSLWTLELVDGDARSLTEIAVSSNAAIVSPAWSPDGKRLAFATIVEPMMREGKKSIAQQDIWTVNIDGTNRQRLTDGNGKNLSPAWSTDNRIFFISDRSGFESIWSVPAQTGDMFTASSGKKTEAVSTTDSK